jgi:hypothetical protein
MADDLDLGAGDERALAALRALAGGGDDVAEQPAPSEAVWDRIAAEAFAPPAGAPDHEPAPTDEVVTPLRPSTRRRTPALLGVAAAIALVLLAAGVVWSVRGGDDAGSDDQVVATAELERLDDGTPATTAEVVEVDGHAQLRLDVGELPATQGFHEVWLGTPELDGLISLGPVRADGTYDLPPGFDVQEFPVVDVSDEPFDGDATHSSVSLLRGQLV